MPSVKTPNDPDAAGYRMRPLEADRPGELDLVVARSLETILESIPELMGNEKEARRRVPNFDHAAMRAMYLRDANRTDTHRLLVAESETDGVVGHALCFLKSFEPEGPLGYLFTIYVAPEHRCRGVGGLLLTEALAWLENRGAARVQAATHPSNQGLLRLTARYGFEVGARHAEPWPHVTLARSRPTSSSRI